MPRKPTTKHANPPKTRKTKADDPAQYERFRQFAREVGADDDREASERATRKIILNSSRR
jgi:hypothetical protein